MMVRISRAYCRGFTLLELLVTIALVAMVVLVLSMALKLAIGAWERGRNQGDSPLVTITIPRLLEKQLESVLQASSMGNRIGKQHLAFCGKKNSFSFFSCYAPIGSSLQGVLRMTYIFDPEKKTLTHYEQVITRPEDLKEEFDPLSENWNGELKPMSIVEGITLFDVKYSGKVMVDPADEEQWKDEWPCTFPYLPRALRLAISMDRADPPKPSVWYLRVGGS